MVDRVQEAIQEEGEQGHTRVPQVALGATPVLQVRVPHQVVRVAAGNAMPAI